MPVTGEAVRDFARKAREDAEAIRRELDVRFDGERERRAEQLAEDADRDLREEREQ